MRGRPNGRLRRCRVRDLRLRRGPRFRHRPRSSRRCSNPAKVLGFLDLAGRWDPSLALVMGGAIAVGGRRLCARRRARPTTLLGTPLRLPTTRGIDARLVGGALVFGVGWGLAGFCPGPALRRARRGPREGVRVCRRDARRECSSSNAIESARIRRVEPPTAAPIRAGERIDADLPPAVRSAVVDLFLPARRSPQRRGGADRSRLRAGAARRRADPRARPEARRDARHARARRSRHRRVAAQASAAAARSRSPRRAAPPGRTAISPTATAWRSATAISRSARRRATRRAA